jgi:putative transcriptional regulator
LADHLNVSRQTVNAIETGKYDPSLPLAFRIAELFELKIEEIFLPAESPTAKQPASPQQAVE